MDSPNTNPNINIIPPPTPAPKKRLGSIIWVILLIILAAAVLIFLTLHNKKNIQQEPSPNQIQTQPTDTMEAERALMLGSSKIKFPTITKAEVVASSTLPAEVASLVHGGASNLQVEKITYGPQGIGYRINYKIPASDMQPLYYSFDTNPRTGYKLLLGLRNLYFSLVELQTANFQIRISLSMTDNNLGQVQIIISPL